MPHIKSLSPHLMSLFANLLVEGMILEPCMNLPRFAGDYTSGLVKRLVVIKRNLLIAATASRFAV